MGIAPPPIAAGMFLRRCLAMTNEANNRKLTILAVLVAGLLVAVIVQSLVILGMHRKLDGGEQRPKRTSVSTTGRDHSKPNLKDLVSNKPSDPDKDLFLWGTEDWDPFKEMQSMQDRINQMFGSAFNHFQRSDDFSSLFQKHPFAPDVNIEDKGDHFLVTVDLPGAEDPHIDVKLEGRTLTITGKVQSETKEEDKGQVLRQERRSGRFERTVTLPGPVKADKMKTTSQKGVLSIEIPKDSK